MDNENTVLETEIDNGITIQSVIDRLKVIGENQPNNSKACVYKKAIKSIKYLAALALNNQDIPSNCPFCGHEPTKIIVDDVTHAVCENASCCLYDNSYAVTAWNIRTEEYDMKKIRDLLESYKRTCMEFAQESHHNGKRDNTKFWTERAKEINLILKLEQENKE